MTTRHITAAAVLCKEKVGVVKAKSIFGVTALVQALTAFSDADNAVVFQEIIGIECRND